MKEIMKPNPMLLMDRLEAIQNTGSIQFVRVVMKEVNRVIFVCRSGLTYKGWLIDLDTHQLWWEANRFTTLPDLVNYFINHKPFKHNKATLNFRSFMDKHKDKF